MNNATAKPAVKKKRFINPALQFAATWRVDSYDLRSFAANVQDLDARMKDEAGFFPIGQRIRFESEGVVVMPGSIDPVSMTSRGPIGEELSMTILQPFEKSLCTGYWSHVCKEKNDYGNSVMISEIWAWSAFYPERPAVWPDMKPVSYTLVHLGKLYNFEMWFAKDGDLMIGVHLDARAKDGGDSGIMAARLKRIKP